SRASFPSPGGRSRAMCRRGGSSPCVPVYGRSERLFSPSSPRPPYRSSFAAPGHQGPAAIDVPNRCVSPRISSKIREGVGIIAPIGTMCADERRSVSARSARTSMNDAIALKGVTKTFGRTTAVQNLDLTVPTGGLWGFIGPNGAGKTTSIRMMMSILFPDSGDISILGRASALEAKDRIGYLPEERGVYRRMRVGAFLVYMARLKGVREVDL